MKRIAFFALAFGLIFWLAGTPSRASTMLSYHGGPIMQSNAAQLIFWLPPGTHFLAPPNDNAANDQAYESAITNFFNSISGTSYLDITTQYPGQCSTNACTAPGNMGAISVANAISDTDAYPESPLQDGDIHNEIHNLIGQRGLPVNMGTEYFVFIAGGEQECNSPFAGCSDTEFCAYHSTDSFNGSNIIYAIFPVADTLGGCSEGQSGNGPGVAEAKETTLVSHELFESITDPLTFISQVSFLNPLPFGATAWWDSTNVFGTNYGNEIGDECNQQSATVTFSSGVQSVQNQWSNDSASCVATFGPSVEFLLSTGGDDLRGDSTASGTLSVIGGGVQGLTLKPSGPDWGNNTTNEIVTALRPGMLPSLSSPLTTVGISMASHASWPESTDSWNLQTVAVNVKTAQGQTVCSMESGGNPLARLSNDSVALPMPNCPATPAPSNPPPTFNQIRFVITTGGDDLRSDSSATASLDASGSNALLQLVTLKQQNDNNSWPNNSTKDLTFNLSSPMSLSQIGSIMVTLTSHNSGFESDDNWNIQSANITLENNGSGAVCFANVTGDPFSRLTGSGPSVTISANQGC